MAEKKALYNLKSGIVLDRIVFVGIGALEMSQCIEAIRAAGAKPLYVVDSAEALFTHKSLVGLIHDNQPLAGPVNEILGNFFTEEQIEALTPNVGHAKAVEKVIQEPMANNGDVIVNLGAKPAAYAFAAVPEGWSVGNNMSLGQTKIKRKMKNSDGDGTMFFMHPDDFAKLWHFASKAWAGEGDVLTAKFNTGVGVKTAAVMDDRISVGGNYIRRYEIEQVAKYRGWPIHGAEQVAA